MDRGFPAATARNPAPRLHLRGPPPGWAWNPRLIRGDPLQDLRVFERFQDNLVLIIQGGRVHKNLLG